MPLSDLFCLFKSLCPYEPLTSGGVCRPYILTCQASYLQPLSQINVREYRRDNQKSKSSYVKQPINQLYR